MAVRRSLSIFARTRLVLRREPSPHLLDLVPPVRAQADPRAHERLVHERDRQPNPQAHQVRVPAERQPNAERDADHIVCTGDRGRLATRARAIGSLSGVPQVQQRSGKLLALRAQDTGRHGTKTIKDLEQRYDRQDEADHRHDT